jgi:hypothetical protein
MSQSSVIFNQNETYYTDLDKHIRATQIAKLIFWTLELTTSEGYENLIWHEIHY